MLARGALKIVDGAAQLGEQLAAWLADPRERARVGLRARECIEDNRGALEKLLRMIDPLLQGAFAATDLGRLRP